MMQVRIVDAQRTRALRRAILRPSWPEDAAMHGDDDPDAVHLALIEDPDVLLAACLLLERPYPQRPEESGTWQLRGMATVPERQGTGLGTRLLDAAVDEARARDGRVLWCEARSSAAGFYARNGFAVDGAEYAHAETGLPHHYMWRRI
jgi:GNAT superfamily N-acetyltransferase